MENAQVDQLTDFEVNLIQASSGKRFANYIIDVLIFYAFIFCCGFVFAIVDTNPDDHNEVALVIGSIKGRLIVLLFYGIFMGLIEAIFRGKTLGKLITGTRVVNEDGSRINFQSAFLRGLSRSVPFEAFSALGAPSYPWHDKWTKTLVIDERQSTLP